MLLAHPKMREIWRDPKHQQAVYHVTEGIHANTTSFKDVLKKRPLPHVPFDLIFLADIAKGSICNLFGLDCFRSVTFLSKDDIANFVLLARAVATVWDGFSIDERENMGIPRSQAKKSTSYSAFFGATGNTRAKHLEIWHLFSDLKEAQERAMVKKICKESAECFDMLAEVQKRVAEVVPNISLVSFEGSDIIYTKQGTRTTIPYAASTDETVFQITYGIARRLVIGFHPLLSPKVFRAILEDPALVANILENPDVIDSLSNEK